LLEGTDAHVPQSWHPTLRRLLDGRPIRSATFGEPSLPLLSAAKNGTARSIEIDEIWLLDDIHHGASVDLNAGVLGPVHNWVDGGRDVIAVIEQTVRKSSQKRIIGMGHSFGGNAM
jgi:hypothetical protein